MADNGKIVEIDPETLSAWMEKGEAVLIDVREPYEYGAERIQGALLMPLATFDPKALPPMGEKKVVLHCGTGKRSGMAARKMIDSGVFDVAYHLAGGIGAWREAKKPIYAINPTTGAIEPKKY